MKFKYDYLTNRLWRIKENEPERLYEIAEQFPANFGGEGFVLGDNQWITFTLCANKIKVFAKQVNAKETIYYRQEIPLVSLSKLPLVIPNQYRTINFELTTADIVEKNAQGQWIKKISATS